MSPYVLSTSLKYPYIQFGGSTLKHSDLSCQVNCTTVAAAAAALLRTLVFAMVLDNFHRCGIAGEGNHLFGTAVANRSLP